MPLKLEYTALDEVPEHFHELYTEKDGKFLLSGIEGVKSQGDIDRVMGGLTKERGDHKKTKEKYNFLDGLDLADVQTRLGRYDELEAAAAGKLDDKKLNELVEKRLEGRVAPLAREKDALLTQVNTYKSDIEKLNGNLLRRDINDSVRTSALAAKVVDTALDDVLMIAGNIFTKTEEGRILTRDDLNGIPGGLDAAAWLNEMKEKRPHWWPASQGAGANGGNKDGTGANPFKKDSWNLTEQTMLVRDKGIEVAERLAKAAGTTVGGRRPEK